MAVLMPSNPPLRSTKAPPLLPGLIAASVCINDSIAVLPCSVLRSMILIFRPFALIIPAVTVEFRLKGFPTANTHSPTLALSESTNARLGSPF